jgi:DNA repair photolyase
MSLATTHHAIGLKRDQVYKGRGAALNLEGRFEQWQREAFDDGWLEEPTHSRDAEAGVGTLAPKTVVTHEIAKSIISKNDSPDIPFRYSVNPYRGCEHGCIYCFARPSHAFLGLSPGLDFETRIFAKTNAAQLLRAELSKASYQCEPISLGIITDAYQPCEKQFQLTRQLLEVMSEFNQPVGVITKSALIERDIEILAPMAARGLVHVTVSLTTQDHHISRYLEPRTAAPNRRFETIQRLSQAGIPVGINVAPVIPFLTDHELENLLDAASQRGATTAGYVLLRLPLELKPLFRDWLQQHFPLKAQHVMSRVQEMRGGKDNDANFGSRMVGEGIFAELLKQRFARACVRFGLNHSGRRRIASLDTSQFCVPGQPIQGALF